MDHATLQTFVDDYTSYAVEMMRGQFAHNVRAISAALDSGNRGILKSLAIFPRTEAALEDRLKARMWAYAEAVDAARMEVGLAGGVVITHHTDIDKMHASMRRGDAETRPHQLAVLDDIHTGTGPLTPETITALTALKEIYARKRRRMVVDSTLPNDPEVRPVFAALAVRDAHVIKNVCAQIMTDTDGDVEADLDPEPSAQRMMEICEYVRSSKGLTDLANRIPQPNHPQIGS